MGNPRGILFLVVAVTVGFPLGFYTSKLIVSYSSTTANEQNRAPATQKQAGGDPQLSNAIRACIHDGPKSELVKFSKVGVDGRSWSMFAIDCQGERAKKLFEAVGPYSSEQFIHLKDRRAGLGRFFGKLHPPSQCIRLIKNAKGREMNLYSCSLHLDLDQDLVSNLSIE